jgi:hypothetical protein
MACQVPLQRSPEMIPLQEAGAVVADNAPPVSGNFSEACGGRSSLPIRVSSVISAHLIARLIKGCRGDAPRVLSVCEKTLAFSTL